MIVKPHHNKQSVNSAVLELAKFIIYYQAKKVLLQVDS